ncbi:MAG TPA: hypothetical protein VFB83_09210 [Propionibacteriaceae bacterium]|nr:hypothetical protein [Propionibacteriaceae bacterium]
MSVVLLLLLIAVVIGGYAVSVKLNPWVKCSKCDGKRTSQGWVFSQAHHRCPKCGGTGRQVRWGYKVFHFGHGGNPRP